MRRSILCDREGCRSCSRFFALSIAPCGKRRQHRPEGWGGRCLYGVKNSSIHPLWINLFYRNRSRAWGFVDRERMDQKITTCGSAWLSTWICGGAAPGGYPQPGCGKFLDRKRADGEVCTAKRNIWAGERECSHIWGGRRSTERGTNGRVFPKKRRLSTVFHELSTGSLGGDVPGSAQVTPTCGVACWPGGSNGALFCLAPGLSVKPAFRAWGLTTPDC